LTADHSDLDDTKILEGSTSEPTPVGRKPDQRSRIRAALFDDRPLAPERIGRFILLDTLGEGGMGTVLEAYDETLDRKVAVKLLHPAIAESNAKRLVREAQALAKLSHPNVVGVYEVGNVEGRTFIAMELVRGETLKQWQGQDPRPGWRECVEVYVQAGQGLAAAHAVGLVHRDFKPGNCVIDNHGRVRVLDFGLVRELDAASVDEPAGASTLLRPTDAALETSLTRTGTVLGTVAYMPLEQLSGALADVQSDQFSFCVSLYEIQPCGSQPRDIWLKHSGSRGVVLWFGVDGSRRGWTGVGTVRANLARWGRASVATRGTSQRWIPCPAGTARAAGRIESGGRISRHDHGPPSSAHFRNAQICMKSSSGLGRHAE
jgi:serine/threonine protein kinase